MLQGGDLDAAHEPYMKVDIKGREIEKSRNKVNATVELFCER